ncbi:MAG: DUF4369 domain-containing protein [Muribaculaceae bacterium]|nr:DUF4369 domain-containing protein [Muribaculaceae bacterium]
MKKICLFFSLILSVLLFSCGDSTEFRIAGVINGMGTQNIKIIYYANGAVRESRAIVIDGKFSVVGNAPEPTLVEIQTTNGVLLGHLMVENGETVECKLENGNRYKASFEGNEVSEKWGKFLTDNSTVLSSDNIDLRNDLIAQYVSKHKEELFSTVLMLTEYYCPNNERTADSILRAISEHARPHSLVEGHEAMFAHVNSATAHNNILPMKIYCKDDSLMTYNPALSSYSVLGFTDDDKSARDSIVPQFKKLSKGKKSRQLKIFDVSLATDTSTWKRITRKDSANWVQCWALGSVRAKGIDRLSIPRLPYFIVVDSTGKQLYRGSSIMRVSQMLDTQINK